MIIIVTSSICLSVHLFLCHLSVCHLSVCSSVCLSFNCHLSCADGSRVSTGKDWRGEPWFLLLSPMWGLSLCVVYTTHTHSLSCLSLTFSPALSPSPLSLTGEECDRHVQLWPLPTEPGGHPPRWSHGMGWRVWTAPAYTNLVPPYFLIGHTHFWFPWLQTDHAHNYSV